MPARARVKRFDFRGFASRVLSQISLVHDAVLVDDERHHAAVPILRRIGNESDPVLQASIDAIAPGAAFRCWALRSQHAVDVTKEWFGRSTLRIALIGSEGEQRPGGAVRIPLRPFPIETVMLTLIATQLFGVHTSGNLVTSDRGVLLLHIHEEPADFDRG